MTESSRRFDLLRERYAQSLPAKRDTLDAAWSAFAADPADDARRALHVLVHRLAGSAPAYGLDALGEHARAVDGSLAEWERDGASPRSADALAQKLAAPMQALLDELTRVARAVASAPLPRLAPGTPLRVIVVEDDPGQAAMIGVQLEALGCAVRVEPGSDALREALATWPCHALVLDFWLRGETAAEIASGLRADPSLSRVALVCYSIERDPEVRRAAVDAGCDAIVGKDEGAARLVDVLRDCVRRRADGAAQASSA